MSCCSSYQNEVDDLKSYNDELEQENNRLRTEHERISGIINGISKVVDSIAEDDVDWFCKVQDIHGLLLSAVQA